jgi:GntR family transcriptional regulator
MFQLDIRDHRPLYEQIKEKMKSLIIKGVLKADQRVPSVRELAQTLTINPNTIQKAYKDLEEEGFIYSVRGKGSFITPMAHIENQSRVSVLLQDLERMIAELVYLQVPKEQLMALINDQYIKGEDGNHD